MVGHEHRLADLDTARAFAGLDLLRIPLLAARVVVVFDDAVAEALRDRLERNALDVELAVAILERAQRATSRALVCPASRIEARAVVTA